jgi:hypothetical protein
VVVPVAAAVAVAVAAVSCCVCWAVAPVAALTSTGAGFHGSIPCLRTSKSSPPANWE